VIQLTNDSLNHVIDDDDDDDVVHFHSAHIHTIECSWRSLRPFIHFLININKHRYVTVIIVFNAI
jgi:ribosome biogenesis protein Tsr3